MFPIITRGTHVLKKSKKGQVISSHCKVIARMFTNIKTADAQIHFFQMLIDRSKFYGIKRLDLKGVVLVSNMDPILQEVATKFEMKIFWDHCYVHQSIVRKLKDESYLNIVLHYVSQIQNCLELKEAKRLTLELESVLTLKKRTLQDSSDILNPNCNKKAWSILKNNTLPVTSITINYVNGLYVT